MSSWLVAARAREPEGLRAGRGRGGGVAARGRCCATWTATTTMRATFDALRKALARRAAAAVLPRHPAEHVPGGHRAPERPASARRARASSSRSPSGTTWPRRGHSTRRCTSISPNRASSASITTWARRRCRTCCTSASPTPFSSRCGTATSSPACRSPWPRRSASPAAARFYEETGAIRDVIQNHLLQIVALLTMEPPVNSRRRVAARREGEAAQGGAPGRPRRSWCAASSTATARSRAWRRTRRWRPTPRWRCRSIRGAGAACRSTCAPASACR